jgi:corrinoid protein of di/trimethylamine methyltransferase
MPSESHREMMQAVVDGDAARARALAEAAVSAEEDLLAAVEHGFVAGIRRVGELWEEGEYFLPELVQGAEAMKAAMAVVTPALRARHLRHEPRGRVVIGTVQGDVHDIGKTLVATLLAANGFEVHDLGADVPVEAFVAKVRETGALIVGASALLTTTMPMQRELVAALAAAGLAGSVKVLVGGSPTTAAWARAIGAAYAENAMRAVAVAESLLRP